MRQVSDSDINHCQILSAPEVAKRLGLPSARERYKYACPACGSSDGLHAYPGEGRGFCCFAGCGRQAYDAIDMVEIVQGCGFKAAVKWLGQEFGFIHGSSDGVDAQEVLERRRREREKRRQERHRRARPVFGELWENMGLGVVGQDYLRHRRIPTPVAWDLGIRSVETECEWQAIRDVLLPGELEQAGLVCDGEDGDPYPLPWQVPFLVIPYWMPNADRLDFLRFRDLSGECNAKYLQPRGLEAEFPFLTHLDLSDGRPTLYICEGELDALSVLLTGEMALASPGASVWQPHWCERFRYYSEVVVLCDGDEGGTEFAKTVAKAARDTLGYDWTTQRLRKQTFRDNTDANDHLVRGTLRDVIHDRTQ